MAKRKDHVTVSNVAGGHLLTCTHCGGAKKVPLPMDYEEWAAVTGRFQRAHKGCPPPGVAAPAARPDDALQARLNAALVALVALAGIHYSYRRKYGGYASDDAISHRLFNESESDALFGVLEAEGLIRKMDDEDGGYAFVSDLTDAAEGAA